MHYILSLKSRVPMQPKCPRKQMHTRPLPGEMCSTFQGVGEEETGVLLPLHLVLGVEKIHCLEDTMTSFPTARTTARTLAGNLSPSTLHCKTDHVLVFYGCCSKLPQTYWLKSTQTYHLTVLRVRNLKQLSMG